MSVNLRKLGHVNNRNERISKNETVMRAANRELQHAEEEVSNGSATRLEVLCECGRDDCDGVLTITLGEFEEVHSQGDRFVVLYGHNTPDIETVVEEREGYLVVDKFGEAEEIAEEESG
jgi:Tfp pilus assembly protein PilX